MLDTCVLCLHKADTLVHGNVDYIGVDRGAYTLAIQKIQMVKAIGDFDSVTAEEKKVMDEYVSSYEILPKEKDVSDTFAAVKWAQEVGYQHLILCDSLAGRMDHTLANLLLYKQFPQLDLSFVNKTNKIQRLRRGKFPLVQSDYPYVSFFALEPTVLSLTGFKYPLKHYLLEETNTLGLSNEWLEKEGVVEVSQGSVLCIQSKDA